MKQYSEMTANVWKVLKKTGDKVAEGDDIIILESMKMEVPISADVTGVITQLNVDEGQMVSEGDLIFELN